MTNKKIKTALLILLAIFLIVFCTVADSVLSSQTVKKTDYAMNAVISIEITDKNAEDAANLIANEIKERENIISWRVESSEIAKINEQKEAKVSERTAKLISDIKAVCEKSGGAVDLTIGGLTRLWNIGSEDFSLPSNDDIQNALDTVNFEKTAVVDNTVSIAAEQFLDLGFVGKGIACDDAKKVLDENKIKRAIINVGGSLLLYGESDFTVGIRNPLGEVNDYFAVLTLSESFVSTSGNYERYSDLDGKRYHHILSTETGYPIENDLLSVTVIAPSGMLSDALSTAVYCLGYEKSLDLLKEYSAEAVFVFADKTVRLTDGIKDKFKIENNEFKLWNEN